MTEISAKPFFHRLQTQTHIFAKFHFFVIFTQKVRAKRKKKRTSPITLFFNSVKNVNARADSKLKNVNYQGLLKYAPFSAQK